MNFRSLSALRAHVANQPRAAPGKKLRDVSSYSTLQQHTRARVRGSQNRRPARQARCPRVQSAPPPYKSAPQDSTVAGKTKVAAGSAGGRPPATNPPRVCAAGARGTGELSTKSTTAAARAACLAVHDATRKRKASQPDGRPRAHSREQHIGTQRPGKRTCCMGIYSRRPRVRASTRAQCPPPVQHPPTAFLLCEYCLLRRQTRERMDFEQQAIFPGFQGFRPASAGAFLFVDGVLFFGLPSSQSWEQLADTLRAPHWPRGQACSLHTSPYPTSLNPVPKHGRRALRCIHFFTVLSIK